MRSAAAGGAGNIPFTSATANATLTLSNLVTLVEIAEISNSTGGTAGTTALNLNALAVTADMQLTGNNGINIIQGHQLHRHHHRQCGQRHADRRWRVPMP